MCQCDVVTSTSFRRHVPAWFLINQCQVITLLILQSDIENSRIELRGIVLQYLQIIFKLHLLLFYPSTWYICDLFLFHIEIEGKYGWIIWRGKGYVVPPLKLLGGGGGWPPCPPPPLPTPVSPLLNYNIVSPILFLPPLDSTRWSNLAGTNVIR